MLEGAAGGVRDGERSECGRLGQSEGEAVSEVDVLLALQDNNHGDEAEDQVKRKTGSTANMLIVALIATRKGARAWIQAAS